MEKNYSVVIKVKYGDVLRRFNVSVVDEKLELSFDGLRKKVSSLFKFPAETELELTYVDEDDDDVTLAEDEDLDDVVRQGLDPVRITVKLKTNKSERMGGYVDHSKVVQMPRNVCVSPMVKPLASSVAKGTINVASNLSKLDAFAGMYGKFGRLGLERSITKPKEQPSLQSDVPESSKTAAATKSFGQLESYLASLRAQAANEQTNSKEPLNESAVNSNKDNCVHGPSSSKRANAVPSSFGSNTTTTNTGNNIPVMKSSSGLIEEKSKNIHLPGPPDCNMSPALLNSRQYPTYKPIRGRASAWWQHCDGCGIFPIVGPIFMSRVKEGHNLCNFCVLQRGNPEDYVEVHMPKEFFPNAHNVLPQMAQGDECFGASSGACMLNSRFIQDVNVFDGTIMPPLTPFTKMWRLRNNGKVVWPQKTRLVWTGGDRLCKGFWFELEIPEAGISVGQELVVSVDFITPEFPGRYTSYWKMSSPSGDLFGQTIWVTIEVDAFLKRTEHDTANGFDLNSPPLRNNADRLAVDQDEPEPMVENNAHLPCNSGKIMAPTLRQPPCRFVNPWMDHEVNAAARTFLLPPSDILNPWFPAPPSSPVTELGPSSVQSHLCRLARERERLLKREQEEILGFRNREAQGLHGNDFEVNLDDYRKMWY